MTPKNTSPISNLIHRAWDWVTHGLKYLRILIFPKTLMGRFVLIILVPLLLLQMVMTIFFYDRHWETISRRLANDIVGDVNMLIETMEQQKITEKSTEMDVFFDRINKNIGFNASFFKHARIKPVAGPDNPETKMLHTILSEQVKKPYTWTENENRGVRLLIQMDDGVLHVEIPRKRFFSSTINVFFVWMIGSSVFLFCVAFLFMKNQIRAIVRLSNASEQFGTGHHTVFFKPEGAQEVRQAGHSFILMKNRISKYILERTEMLAGVSHDLRTPLTRMKLQLSMMDENNQTRDLESDISEMEEMLNAYLAFTKGEDKNPPEEIDLNGFMHDLYEKAVKSGQRIDYHAEQNVSVMGRSNDLRRAVNNIIVNAGRYAKNTAITLGVRSNMATITVDDDGPGIPPAKQKDVFKAFFRIDKSRNTKTGGIGLGLTISRDIVLAHGGDIQLSNKSALGGLRVVIRLPLNES